MDNVGGPFFKQVIVVRKDLNVRRGKEIAQACHASRGALEKADEEVSEFWIMQGETKIVVGIEGKGELFDLYKEVNTSGLPCQLVRDHGHTELEPGTMTAVGIGPAEDKEIDEFTSHLELL